MNNRDRGLAMLTDKLKTKRLAEEILGEAIVIPTLWQGDELPQWPAWPMPFIVKANHGCGQFAVVRTMADWRRARERAPRWLRSAYGTWLDEWHYRGAQRTLLIEPFVGPANSLPLDYKIYVFGGVAQVIQVHVGRATDHRWVQFSRTWEKLSHADADIEEPKRLADMLGAAELMAAGRDHLRVDFYEVEGKLWFGETCLYPGSGLDRFNPLSLDEKLGAMWSKAHQISR